MLRWQTSNVSDSKVQYGTSLNNLSSSTTGSNSSTTDHIVELSGLTPNTKYYYSVGTSNLTLEEDEVITF